MRRRSMLARRAAVTFALALLALGPLLPLLLAGRFPHTHDGIRYEVLTQLLLDAIRNGVWYPRWLPQLDGFAGYPTFVFYQPLVFWLSVACAALPGVTPSMPVWIAMYALLFAGAAGAYRLGRLWLGRPASAAVAALFLLTPYLYVNLYVRGDYSEAAAMLLSPWPLWAVVAVGRRVRAGLAARGVALAGVVALAAVLYAHPAVALFYVPTLAAVALAGAIASPRGVRVRVLKLYVAIAVAALVASSPNWLVVFQNAPYARLDRVNSLEYDVPDHTVGAAELLGRDWGFGTSRLPPRIAARSAHVEADPMARRLGAPHALLLFAGLAAAVARRRRAFPVAIALAGVALVLAVTPISAPFWRHAGGLPRLIQFPWRLLAAAAPFACAAGAIALAALGPGRRAAIVAWAVVVVTIAWSWPMFRTSPTPYAFVDGPRHLSWRDADAHVANTIATLPDQTQPLALTNEFQPVWVVEPDPPRGDRPMIVGRPTVRERPGSDAYRIDADVEAAAADAVVIWQSYFPGWRVEVNGRAIDDDDLRASVTPGGKMVVPVPAGTSHLVAYFDGPQHWRPRVAATLVLLVASVALVARLARPPRG